MEPDRHGRMYAVAFRAPASCRGFSFVRQQDLAQDLAQVTMAAVHRLAMRSDASRLYEVRRRSILELAPPAMAAAEAKAWAAQLTPSGMERKLRELEVRVTELDGAAAGWATGRPVRKHLKAPGL